MTGPLAGPNCPKCGTQTRVIGRCRLSELSDEFVYYACGGCQHCGDTRPNLK